MSQTLEDKVAPDCRGANFFEIDPDIDALSALYLPADLRAHLRPSYQRMGEIAGGELEDLAAVADRNPPVLHRGTDSGTTRIGSNIIPPTRKWNGSGFLISVFRR